ncbi:beta-galactosidase [Opitutaceae bacterium TAV5]|nr:beta-galactosidase [Opitutaceae bacterium TAV5]
MRLGIQYYRPPFPTAPRWADDLRRIRDAGIDTLQLWVTWAWVESTPGTFNYDDYDRIVDLAGRNDLDLILSTIAEIQPHWIHREVPGSEMIDHRGHRVISSLRNECHFGLTPGGCTGNPAVWERMAAFLETTVNRYRTRPRLAGWDAWNELRWHEQSDGLVCFCPHCIREFHAWLDARHGGLDGLNRAWQRRYSAWDEVRPGKLPDRTFTEMIAWQRFITWKANRHGRRRYDLIKSLDPARPVTVHAGSPSPLTAGWSEGSYAIDRGNDWHYADDLDGVGCSSFPRLRSDMDDATFSARVAYARSAATGGKNGPKKLWLSEVQGGRGSFGFTLFKTVTAPEQQRWIWRGLAGGADTLLFWCWRDEVFGRESSGFGLAGRDGQADARIAAMRRTAGIFRKHRDLLAACQPAPADVGVLFSPSSYYLHWSLEGTAGTPRKAIEGYCLALTCRSIPYVVVEEEHLHLLRDLRVLFLPRVIVADRKLEDALADFVLRGGTLVCESECAAFTPEGIYREPEERFFARPGLLPGGEIGRRDLPSDNADLACDGLSLMPRQWLTPWADFPGKVLAPHADGVLVGIAPAGERGGRILHIGTYLGDAYADHRYPDFEAFVARCADAAPLPVRPLTEPEAEWFIRIAGSGASRLAFVFFPPGIASARFEIAPDFSTNPAAQLTELITGVPCTSEPGHPRRLRLDAGEWGIAVLASVSD